jgi:dodecin
LKKFYNIKENPMTDHVYKIVEIAGTSSTSIEDAVKNALAKASKTVRNMH